jgi:hypothetical protein
VAELSYVLLLLGLIAVFRVFCRPLNKRQNIAFDFNTTASFYITSNALFTV